MLEAGLDEINELNGMSYCLACVGDVFLMVADHLSTENFNFQNFP
jgi:hypothetical protein